MVEHEILVQFSMVQKTYDGETLVVKDLNLDIRRGEFLTLLGPSGSGKTTSLMMLAGFEMPTGGDIMLDGRPINNVPPHKRNIGMVFQNYALFPHMTVAENVAFPLEVRKVGQGRDRTAGEAALDDGRAGADCAQRRPAQLSGGQQQRVALARALVFDPQLVLMDEPLGALDKQLREHMQLEIKRLHEQLGITVVYVTHDQCEALTMSDRIAVFNDGLIQQIDAARRAVRAARRTASSPTSSARTTICTGRSSSVDGDRCIVRLGDGGPVAGLARQAHRARDCPDPLSIRPERLFIGDAPAAATNRLPGPSVESIYLGDHLRVVHGRRRAFRPHDQAAGAGRDQRDPRPATRIELSFRAEDCRALDPLWQPPAVTSPSITGSPGMKKQHSLLSPSLPRAVACLCTPAPPRRATSPSCPGAAPTRMARRPPISSLSRPRPDPR